jgi:flagellar basal-body rod protein FlgC
MSSVQSIAVSGMLAASRRLEVSAQNVANVRSDGALPDAQGNYSSDAPRPYTPQRVDQVDLATGGTRAVVTDVSPSYVATYNPSAPYANHDGMVAAPNVDLADEVVQRLMASYAYAANARVVTSHNQMVKSLFDISV